MCAAAAEEVVKKNQLSLSLEFVYSFLFFQPLQPMKSPLVGWFTLTYGLCCLCCREWWCFYAERSLSLFEYPQNFVRRSPICCALKAAAKRVRISKNRVDFFGKGKKAYRPQIPTNSFPSASYLLLLVLLWGEFFLFLLSVHFSHHTQFRRRVFTGLSKGEEYMIQEFRCRVRQLKILARKEDITSWEFGKNITYK